jgi:hypothetical protein
MLNQSHCANLVSDICDKQVIFLSYIVLPKANISFCMPNQSYGANLVSDSCDKRVTLLRGMLYLPKQTDHFESPVYLLVLLYSFWYLWWMSLTSESHIVLTKANRSLWIPSLSLGASVQFLIPVMSESNISEAYCTL